MRESPIATLTKHRHLPRYISIPLLAVTLALAALVYSAPTFT